MNYVFRNSDLERSKFMVFLHSLYFVFTLGRGGGRGT